MSDNSPESAANGSGSQFAGVAPQSAVGAGAAHGKVASTAEHVAEQARQPAMTDDLCRLTVCGPGRSAELAVPVRVPLIDLLPALVGHVGDGLPDAGLEHGGWVLQRLGDPPLREELSVTALGLHDGDVVHLRPRAEQLPPLDFDDLIDGIATGISARPDRWRPDMSRRLLAALLAAPLAAGLGLLAGHIGALSSLLAAAMALVLIGLTATASRAFADLAAADVLGASAICYAGLAAAELPLLPGSAGQASLAWRPMLLACGAAVTGAATAVSLARGGRHPTLVATSVGSVLVAVGGALAIFARLDAAAVAGILLALMMPLGGWVPVIAFRLANMRLDPTPSTPDELQAELDPVPGQGLLENTRMADRYMTGLYSGLGVVVTGCLAVLSLTTGWPARVVALDTIALMLLHARVLVSARHRLAVVIPAICGAAVLVTVAGLRTDARAWPVGMAAVVIAVGLLFAGERSLPGYKLLPHWGRAGDLLHTATAVALIPAVLWLLNLYQFARTGHG
ncbi:MAG TPA: type VII secretion integral membrane protein EccD [Streptosporangiaceae bacterium]